MRLAGGLLIALGLMACNAPQQLSFAHEAPIRVPFVGNSLTYVRNLPAVFGVLASK